MFILDTTHITSGCVQEKYEAKKYIVKILYT